MSASGSPLRRGFSLILALGLLVGCSSTAPVTAEPTPTFAEPAESLDSDEATVSPTSTPAPSQSPAPTGPLRPSLDRSAFELIQDLNAGQQVADAQGNLVTIYGAMALPRSFSDLRADAREALPWLRGLESLARSDGQVVALDIGWCRAGIDVVEVDGLAEFFVAVGADDALIATAEPDEAFFVGLPIVSPGFDFPEAATCVRGWLAIRTEADTLPSVARYVLSTRSPTGDIERHLYQWAINVQREADTSGSVAALAAGQQATFSAGQLAGTSITVDGWAELITAESGLADTRVVAASITACPATDAWPQFALVIDGWALLGPLDGDERLGSTARSCGSGWLEFVVPFGSEPTGLVVSDGRGGLTGVTEWSLAGAAVAAPE